DVVEIDAVTADGSRGWLDNEVAQSNAADLIRWAARLDGSDENSPLVAASQGEAVKRRVVRTPAVQRLHDNRVPGARDTQNRRRRATRGDDRDAGGNPEL